MKPTNLMGLAIAGLTLTLGVSGCITKKPENVTQFPTTTPIHPPQIENATPFADQKEDLARLKLRDLDPKIESGIPLPELKDFDGLVPNPDVFKGNTVHFAYDSSTVKTDEETKILAVAEFLKSNKANALKIEGHCDERGTEEYNRSLGERRALAIREELVRLGIDPGHILTVTFGKDRPVDSNHEEGAWNKNRRGEFVLLTPPK